MQTSYAVNQKLASLFSLARKDSNRCRSTCWIAGLMTNIQEDSKISSFFFFFPLPFFLSSFSFPLCSAAFLFGDVDG